MEQERCHSVGGGASGSSGGGGGSSSSSSRSYELGAAASFLSTLATFPVHKTIFRQQLHTLPLCRAAGQLRQEGLARLYRGASPPLLAKTLQGTILFGSHESFLHLLSNHSATPSSLGDRASAGLLAGLLEALVLCPLERVQNVLQDGRKVGRFPTAGSILREFNAYAPRERAWLGYYRGLGLILTRNGFGSCLYFSFKDPLRDSLSNGCLPGWLPALVAGSVSGTSICLLLYPLSVLITHVQSQVGKQEALPLRAALKEVWKGCGRQVPLLYRGGALLVFRSGLTWGLTTAIHDTLQRAMEPSAPALGPVV